MKRQILFFATSTLLAVYLSEPLAWGQTPPSSPPASTGEEPGSTPPSSTPPPADSAAPPVDSGAAPPTPEAPAQDASASNSKGSFLIGAKVGGIAPFDGLNPFVIGTVELGYVLPWLNRGIAGLVAVSYTAPNAAGEQADPRVPGGAYTWSLTQHELIIQPTVMYRYTKLGRIVPFVGIGPRIYLMNSVVTGKAGEEVIGETSETSTQIGGGLPLGVEYLLGPGALLGELLFEVGTLDHTITGKSHTAGLSLNIGYRFMP